jgi:hypothetical protein
MRSHSPEVGSITVKEKVDTYLSGLPSLTESRKIAIELDQSPDTLSKILDSTRGEPIRMSLCGPLAELKKVPIDEVDDVFKSKIITYEKFCDTPDLLLNPKTVFLLNGYYHQWNTAAPIIMSELLFQQSLGTESLGKLLSIKNPSKSSWFSWGRSTTQDLKTKQSEPILNKNTFTNPGSPASPSIISSIMETRPNYAKSLRMTSDQLVYL